MREPIPPILCWVVAGALRSAQELRVEVAGFEHDALLVAMRARYPELVQARGARIAEANATQPSADARVVVRRSTDGTWSAELRRGDSSRSVELPSPRGRLVVVPGVADADGQLEPDGIARACAARRTRGTICASGGVKSRIQTHGEAEQIAEHCGRPVLLELGSRTTSENVHALVELCDIVEPCRIALVIQPWHAIRLLLFIGLARPRLLGRVRISLVRSRMTRGDHVRTWIRELRLLGHVRRNRSEARTWALRGGTTLGAARLLDGVRHRP